MNGNGSGNLKLYGTRFCHLCEETEEILQEAGISTIKIDIAEDENLFEKYSLRIPVLHRVDNDAELAWPFDADDISRLLK